jgi:hypothetical protein
MLMIVVLRNFGPWLVGNIQVLRIPPEFVATNPNAMLEALR